eukprot:scaffold16353_cov59-Phaeocystis_antarctica.AAC.4
MAPSARAFGAGLRPPLAITCATSGTRRGHAMRGRFSGVPFFLRFVVASSSLEQAQGRAAKQARARVMPCLPRMPR